MKAVINSTVAAKMNLHHESQVSKADLVANQIDRKIAALWNKILQVLNSKQPITHKQFQIRNLLMMLLDVSSGKLAKGLTSIAKQAYQDATKTLTANIPLGHLNLVASAKPVLEDQDAVRQQISDAVFQQLPPEKVDKIVRGTTAGMSWQGRMAQQTSKGSPDQLASIVTMGYLSGATPASLAGKLKPYVQNISSTARRIARNESMRIAHESSMEAYEELGDMVVGYQIHATMDSRVRPHHAARSGTVYYKNPKPGQLSVAKMPRPPLEDDGTVAHNCRCWITPVLEVQAQVEDDPAAKAVFTDAKDNLIPNPAVYTDWFVTASEQDKMRVVGARRLKVVRNRLQPGEKLSWGHFVDPESGKLLDKDELWVEAPEKQKERLKKFDALIQQRKKLTQDVYTYGYEPPENSNLANPPVTIPPLNPPTVLVNQPDILASPLAPSSIEKDSVVNEKEYLQNAFLKEEPTTILISRIEKPKLLNLSKQKTIPNMQMPAYLQTERVSEHSDLGKKLKADGDQTPAFIGFVVKDTVSFLNGMASMMAEVDEDFFDRYETDRQKRILKNRALNTIENLIVAPEHTLKGIYYFDSAVGVLKEEYAPEVYNTIINSNFVRTVKTAVKEKLKMKEENPQAFQKEFLKICGGKQNYSSFMEKHSKRFVNSIDPSQQAALIMVQHDMLAAELETGKVSDPESLKLFRPLAKKFYEQHLKKELPLAKISKSMEKIDQKLSALKEPIDVYNPKLNRYEAVYNIPPEKRQEANQEFHRELFASLDNKKKPIDKPQFTFTHDEHDKKKTYDLGFKENFNFDKILKRTEQEISKGMDWLSQIAGGSDLNVPVHYVDPDSKKFVDRAFANSNGIFLNPKGSGKQDDNRHFIGTVIHETGHYIEQDPEISKMVQGFLNYRIGMEKPIRFNDRPDLKNRGYSNSEKGVDDDFGKAFKYAAHYVGKIYDFGATEILSMGLEKLYKEPEEFIKKDPEYAAFVIKTVRYYRDKRKKGLA